MLGWIALHRSIQEHWLWEDPKRLKWWIDLLLMANHKENKILVNGVLTTIERGERLTSEQILAERWEVSRNTVRKFLKLLEDDGMISVVKSRQIGTTYKVLNYNLYQGINGDKKHQTEQRNEQQKDNKLNNELNINNNENNDNNDNKKESRNSSKLKYADDSPYYKLAVHLFNHLKQRNTEHKEPNFQTWADDVRKAVELDKRTIQGLTEVLDWSQQDQFWQVNILSTKKLREKYDTLKQQMGRSNQSHSTKPVLGFTEAAPSDPKDVVHSDETLKFVSEAIDKGDFTPEAEDIPKINDWRRRNGLKELDQYAKN